MEVQKFRHNNNERGKYMGKLGGGLMELKYTKILALLKKW